MLVSVAIVLYGLQFVVYLLLSRTASVALAILFAALSIVYQGMVVELVQDIQDGRRDHSIGDLIRSVEPVFGRWLPYRSCSALRWRSVSCS